MTLLGLARCTSDGSCCCCDGGVFAYEMLLPDHERVEAAALERARTSEALASALGGAPTSLAIDEDALGAPDIDMRRTRDGQTVHTVPITATRAGVSAAIIVYIARSGDEWVAVGATIDGASEGEVPELQPISSGGGGGWG